MQVILIYHLCWLQDWKTLTAAGEYRPASLAAEGFIHATREPDWLLRVASMFFPLDHADALLILTLEEGRIAAPIRDEDPGCGHLFPHIYGPLPTAAVSSQQEMTRGLAGWELPTALRESDDG